MNQRYKFNLIELSTPLLMLGWATWFLLFDSVAVSQTYTYLVILPNYLWAAIFGAVGGLKAWSIVYDRYVLRRIAAGVSVALWLVMCGLFAWGNHRSHMIPTCLFFAYQSFLSWHRIMPALSK